MTVVRDDEAKDASKVGQMCSSVEEFDGRATLISARATEAHSSNLSEDRKLKFQGGREKNSAPRPGDL